MPSNKKAHRKTAGSRAKRRQKTKIIVGATILTALIIAVIVGGIFSALTQVYTDGSASIELRPNGRFSAVLHHNERYAGTYTTSQSGGATLVHLTHDGVTTIAMILDYGFVIPDEWDDGHGHGSVLPKR